MAAFTHVGPCKIEDEPSHHAVFTSDALVYLVSTKGVRQDTYSYFHRTALTGGTVYTYKDGKPTEEPVSFGPIDDDENREDVAFAVGSRMYMLVYSRYTQFEYRQLLLWADGKWSPVELQADELTREQLGSHCAELVLVDRPVDKEHLHLLLHTAQGTTLHVLKLGKDKATIKLVAADRVLENKLEAVVVTPMPVPGWQPVLAAECDGHVFAIGGCHGCGFRWEPGHLLVIDASNGQTQVAETSGDIPRWAFSGPRFHQLYGGSKWLMFGGSVASGMTNSNPCLFVHSLDLSSKAWQKEPFEMPKELTHSTAAGDGKAHFALCDPAKGIFLLKL